MTTAAPPITNCRRCGSAIAPGILACSNCGLFTHAAELERYAREALQQEPVNTWAAAAIWRQCLELMPIDSPQYRDIQSRIAVLSAGLQPADSLHAPAGPGGDGATPVLNYQPRDETPTSFTRSLALTLGSMVVSILVYDYFWHNILFAAGFCVLMLVHEMGHVIANSYYGLRASAPVFIPFMGAVINLKQRPPNAKVEAIIGIAGPVLGTVGALACYFAYLRTGWSLLGACAYFGFMLNLFNLLPVPPLDGGRVTAAVSPWIWVLGLAGLAWLFIDDYQKTGHINYILIVVVFWAFPRIRATLRGRERFGEYYNITRRASWTIAVLYVGLGALLLYFYQVSGSSF